ncbi:MAG: hypothetical protein GY772_17730, partial [bacterium]|nr:hypothetical protein [bacterium]
MLSVSICTTYRQHTKWQTFLQKHLRHLSSNDPLTSIVRTNALVSGALCASHASDALALKNHPAVAVMAQQPNPDEEAKQNEPPQPTSSVQETAASVVLLDPLPPLQQMLPLPGQETLPAVAKALPAGVPTGVEGQELWMRWQEKKQEEAQTEIRALLMQAEQQTAQMEYQRQQAQQHYQVLLQKAAPTALLQQRQEEVYQQQSATLQAFLQQYHAQRPVAVAQALPQRPIAEAQALPQRPITSG